MKPAIHASCGRVWPGDWETAADRPRCQRTPGHAGAHVVDIPSGVDVLRYWWSGTPGDVGTTVYSEWEPDLAC